jgi:hypothetical protein
MMWWFCVLQRYIKGNHIDLMIRLALQLTVLYAIEDISKLDCEHQMLCSSPSRNYTLPKPVQDPSMRDHACVPKICRLVIHERAALYSKDIRYSSCVLSLPPASSLEVRYTSINFLLLTSKCSICDTWARGLYPTHYICWLWAFVLSHRLLIAVHKTTSSAYLAPPTSLHTTAHCI